MAELICTAITSLDGYTADEHGAFDWGEPDGDVHAFINDLERPIGTYLYGRRLYQVMVFWETASAQPNQPPPVLDYAQLWQAADKIVYSTTLQTLGSARTRIERTFDPSAVRAMKDAADHDLSIGGSALLPTRSEPGWWTRSACSCPRWSSAAATGFCPTGSVSICSYAVSAGSTTASYFCSTESRADTRTFGSSRRVGICPSGCPAPISCSLNREKVAASFFGDLPAGQSAGSIARLSSSTASTSVSRGVGSTSRAASSAPSRASAAST
jgi:RibD C-terminal domain